ncbi:MAG: hypothetical protein AAFR55_03540 [Pseudomonadota bacterium]
MGQSSKPASDAARGTRDPHTLEWGDPTPAPAAHGPTSAGARGSRETDAGASAAVAPPPGPTTGAAAPPPRPSLREKLATEAAPPPLPGADPAAATPSASQPLPPTSLPPPLALEPVDGDAPRQPSQPLDLSALPTLSAAAAAAARGGVSSDPGSPTPTSAPTTTAFVGNAARQLDPVAPPDLPGIDLAPSSETAGATALPSDDAAKSTGRGKRTKPSGFTESRGTSADAQPDAGKATAGGTAAGKAAAAAEDGTGSAIDDLIAARDRRRAENDPSAPRAATAPRHMGRGPGAADAASDDDAETTGHSAKTSGDQPERRRARRRPAGAPRDQIAANDDQPSIGGLIYALNRKPSNKPFSIAMIASVAWLTVSLLFGYFLIAPDLAQATSIGAFIRNSAITTVLATIAGPIALAWFLAFLAWRSEELHLRSTAMTEVAVRLAEPDRMAEQQISSLGQAVRREVTFMNDAVSHALSRANELDSLVQSEVHALERSYEDNERKIRSLLQELASERNSLSGTGEHFKQTLATLAHDVPTLIERLSEQQGKLAGIIAGAGDNLTALESSLSTRTGELQVTLTDRTQELQRVLETHAGELGSTLQSRTDHVQTMLTAQNTTLAATLDEHRTGVEGTLSGYTTALSGADRSKPQADIEARGNRFDIDRRA